MKKQKLTRKNKGLYYWVIIGYLSLFSELGAQELNPHDLTANANTDLCQQCHINKDLHSKQKNYPAMIFKKDEISMCMNCHAHDASTHSINIEVDFSIPADLPLSSTGKITCLTCHTVHGRLRSQRPWASCNFMDYLLDRERLTKTYLLRRNNAHGELCLACHDPEEKHNHE